MDLTAFYSQFRDEVVENHRVIGDGLLTLEDAALPLDERRAAIDRVFRAMHTVKGSARLLGIETVGAVAHTCEHALMDLRDGRRAMNRPLTDALLRGADIVLELVHTVVDGRQPTVDVQEQLAALEAALAPSTPVAPPAVANDPVAAPSAAPATPPAPTAVPPAPPAIPAAPAAPTAPAAVPPAAPATRQRRAAGHQTIRVRVDRLDALLNIAGELAIGRQTRVAHLDALAQLEDLVAQQQRSIAQLEQELGRLRFSPSQRADLDTRLEKIGALGQQIDGVATRQNQRFAQYASHTTQLVEDFEQEVISARLLPIANAFAHLPRAVRELARDLGREVTLTLEGEHTELDRKVIEALGDPLTHLVRNALDHGIEPPDERQRCGKPATGTITIAAQTLGSSALVTIRDDGRGMDPRRLRESAVRKGLVDQATAASMTDQESLELIFVPGFSTAQMITDISGRGVGMDVVRTSIVELGGQVQLTSQVGVGTSVTLVLPLTLVTTRVLLIELGADMFAVPAASCHASIWVYPDRLRTVEGRAMVELSDGELVPLVHLERLLGLPTERALDQRRHPALVVGSGRKMAVLVDRLIDERDAMIKPLGALLEGERRFGGAFQLGDGRLALMINVALLVQQMRGATLASGTMRAARAPRARRLLVTDDSFATRELVRSILTTAGYDVTTAVDGQDAVEKLRVSQFDLLMSDIEMPRLDGFSLAERVRGELGIAEMPIVLMTSLATEDHKRRGLHVGAQAYIVKSQFSQGSLLDIIHQLLGEAA